METIGYKEALKVVKKLSAEDKLKLLDALKQESFEELLTKLRKKTKGLKISFKEITDEVEAVRTDRYERKQRSANRH